MADQTRGAAAAAELETTIAEILAEVERMPVGLLHWVPGENVWTIMDNLCHIREFVPFWTAQTLNIVRTPAEHWGRDHTDTARVAAVTSTARFALADVIGDIRREVTKCAGVLRTLSDADLAIEATSRNPRWGMKPAAFVVDELLVHHVKKHLGQIRRTVSQYQVKG